MSGAVCTDNIMKQTHDDIIVVYTLFIWYIFSMLVNVDIFLLLFFLTSWRSVLLVEETGVPWENHRPAASHWRTLSHNNGWRPQTTTPDQIQNIGRWNISGSIYDIKRTIFNASQCRYFSITIFSYFLYFYRMPSSVETGLDDSTLFFPV
jgi:hypothetical protein